MATALSTPLSDPGGCLICQRLALAVVLVDLGNTSKEIIRCFSITARFAGSHRSLQPNTARLPVQSVPVTIRQRLAVAQLDRARVSVLVPRKAKALHPILATGRKVLNVAGWVYSGYEAYEAGKKCARQIK